MLMCGSQVSMLMYDSQLSMLMCVSQLSTLWMMEEETITFARSVKGVTHGTDCGGDEQFGLSHTVK